MSNDPTDPTDDSTASDTPTPADIENFRTTVGIDHADDSGNEGIPQSDLDELRGQMSEAPEHVQRKSPDEVTDEDLAFLDDEARAEVEELLSLTEDGDGDGGNSEMEDTPEPPGAENNAGATSAEQNVGSATPAETQTVTPDPAGAVSDTAPGDGPSGDEPSSTPASTPTPAADTSSDPDGSPPSSSPASDTSDDGEPGQGTLSETGLVDEDDAFPWETEGEETEMGERDRASITIKGTTFELTEPEDSQELENASRHLQGVQDASESERKEASHAYMKDLAHSVYTYDGLSLGQIYLYKTPEGEPNKILNTRDHEGCADHPRTTPFWEGITPIDRSKMGARASNFIEGSGRFRSTPR